MHTMKRLKDLYFRHSVFSRPLVRRTLYGLFRTVAACPVRLLFKSRKRPVEATCRLTQPGKRHGLCMPAQERVLRRSTAKTDKKEKQFGSRPCVGVSFGTRGKSASRHHKSAIFFLDRLALQCFEDEAEDFEEAFLFRFLFFSSSFSTLFLSASASAIAMMSSVSGSPADINSP